MRLPAHVTIAHEGPYRLLLLTGLLYTAGHEGFTAKRRVFAWTLQCGYASLDLE